MKKFMLLLLCCLCLAALSACQTGPSLEDLELTGTYTDEYAGTTLNVANWGEYISDGSEGTLDVNAVFEELTGITVNYSYYDSNEALYGKLASGAVSYDVIVPSDYMIERMIADELIQPLDTSKLSNYSNIDPFFLNAYYDPDDAYSVPYFAGTLGMVYNSSMVETEPTGWTGLWDPAYEGNILTFNNARDCFSLAMLILDIEVNTDDLTEWDQAADLLKEQSPLLQGRVGDEIFNKMEGGNAAIAGCYAGDYLLMVENNEDLRFVYPEEGTTYFVEALCIPSNAQNYEAALMYIDFMLEYEVALANAEYTVYTSPVKPVVESTEYTYYGNELLYPGEEYLRSLQCYQDLDPQVRSYYEDLWEEVLLAGD